MSCESLGVRGRRSSRRARGQLTPTAGDDLYRNTEMQRLGAIHRLRPLILAGVLFIAATPASAATSHAKIWTALGNDLGCGVAIHPPGKPPTQVVCSDRTIPPPPHGVGYGDPGFVFLGAHGHPILARTTQDSFEGANPVALTSGRTWSDLGITCTISTTTVRCVNRSAHGFTIGVHSYKPF